MIEVLSPGLVALGLCLAIIPWLHRDNVVARSFLAAVSVLLLLHYWWWRLTATIPPAGLNADFVVGALFFVAETAALLAGALALLFLSRTKVRAERAADRCLHLHLQRGSRDPGAHHHRRHGHALSELPGVGA